MKNLNQLILKFDQEQNFRDQDFYVSKSNEFSFKLLDMAKLGKKFCKFDWRKFFRKNTFDKYFFKEI